jgi:hypothetical protein
MSRTETKLRTIRYLQTGASAGFNFGADCGRESVRGAVVAVTLFSLIAAFAAPAIAHELSICQSDISASEPTPQAKPAVAADPLANGAPEGTAILPSLDSIEAQTDITVFLQSCVPAELRLAALRRAWTVDPAIRDFKELSEND